MSDIFSLTDAQMARLELFFPKSHGKPRVDNRRALSGIIFINRNELRGRNAPSAYDSHKTLYSLWKQWSDKSIFAQMTTGLDAEHGEEKTVTIASTYLKAALTATGLGEKRGRRRLISRTDGGKNTNSHAILDGRGRLLNLFATAGQISDYIRARALLSSLPDVDWLLGDRGYDADWLREAFKDEGIRACNPGRKQRKKQVKYDNRRYKPRNRIEIMLGRLKDWRPVATRYDKCPRFLCQLSPSQQS